MNLDNNKLAIGILKRLFGLPKGREYDGQVQYEFNCPSKVCKNDKDKYNLNYQSVRHIFRCFKCNYKGYLNRLVKDYGTSEDLERINILFPYEFNFKKSDNQEAAEFNESLTCELPEGYRPLTKKYNSAYYTKAMNYLISRKVDDSIIKKYEIGYTESGPRKYRIIIPSRNNNGDINYYEARSFFPKSKIPYFKPDYPNKTDIIFNLSNINFDLPVYLVEGVFDMFPIDNCIPLLGKDLSPLLLSKFIRHKTKVIICLDEDAIDDSIKLYDVLSAHGIDAYIVDIKDDVAKFYELHGREELIKMLQTYHKPDFTYLFKLKFRKKKKSVKHSASDLEVEMISQRKQFDELNTDNL